MEFAFIGLGIFAAFFLIGVFIISLPSIIKSFKGENFGYQPDEMIETRSLKQSKFASGNADYDKTQEYFKD